MLRPPLGRQVVKSGPVYGCCANSAAIARGDAAVLAAIAAVVASSAAAVTSHAAVKGSSDALVALHAAVVASRTSAAASRASVRAFNTSKRHLRPTVRALSSSVGAARDAAPPLHTRGFIVMRVGVTGTRDGASGARDTRAVARGGGAGTRDSERGKRYCRSGTRCGGAGRCVGTGVTRDPSVDADARVVVNVGMTIVAEVGTGMSRVGARVTSDSARVARLGLTVDAGPSSRHARRTEGETRRCCRRATRRQRWARGRARWERRCSRRERRLARCARCARRARRARQGKRTRPRRVGAAIGPRSDRNRDHIPLHIPRARNRGRSQPPQRMSVF